MELRVSTFLDAFLCWASEKADIDGVALVGSYARGSADEDSDIDLVVLTSNVSYYLCDWSWVSQFGNATECRQEDWGRVISLRVRYDEGLEVEYGFSTPDWASVPTDAGTWEVISNGMKTLYDPKGILLTLQLEIRN
jgi:predicted nucleotidyltransferase